jgi:hypothetical protein
MTEKTEKRLDEAEARRILEGLARHGPPTAQVASIKVLREMDKAAKEAEEAEREAKRIPQGWEGLCDDEFSRRQREKAARYGKGGGRAA